MHQELLQIFQKELPCTSRAKEIYAALCNNVWTKENHKVCVSWRMAGQIVADTRNALDPPLQDPDLCELCHKKRSEHFLVPQKTFLGELLGSSKEPFTIEATCCDPEGTQFFMAGYTGPEDYMDFYCSGGEGQVEPWIEKKLQAAGWTHQPI